MPCGMIDWPLPPFKTDFLFIPQLQLLFPFSSLLHIATLQLLLLLLCCSASLLLSGLHVPPMILHDGTLQLAG